MSADSAARVSQLGYAYDAVKHIFTSCFTFIAIAASAEAVLITFTVREKSQLALALGGVVVLATLRQLRTAGRALAVTAATALWLEEHLDLGNTPSPMAAFLGAAFGPERLRDLRAAARVEASAAVTQTWIDKVSGHAVFRFQGNTLAALVLAVVQIIVAVVWWCIAHRDDVELILI